MKKILIIEDEKNLAFLLHKTLKNENYEVFLINDGAKAIDSFLNINPDVVLLDINLPNKNGWDICKEIRNFSSKPIIMMTARDTELEEIHGLEIGANDYITKPFNLKLILLKLRKILNIENYEPVKINDLIFDFKNYKLYLNHESIVLAKREAEVLNYFIKNENIVLSREKLLNEIWGFNFLGDERAVDTLIKRVRKKLGPYSDLIKSIRGVGYVFEKI